MPMYDRPETAAATDRFWALIRNGLRARGIDAPDALTRGQGPWTIWTAPDMVFSQTCGLPYAAKLKGKVSLVALPDHQIDGCAPGQYRSVIITRPGPLPQTPTRAVNEALSQSGWANLLEWLEETSTPIGPVLMTGAHRASARAVADGRADLAAIDAQTWWLMCQYDRFTDRLTVIAQTTPLAGLPFIAPLGADIDTYRSALSKAIGQLASEDKATLNLHGIVPTSDADFATRSIPPKP